MPKGVELTIPSSPDIESIPVVLIDPRSEGPIRAERLGLERLEGYAARLATACVLAPPRRAGSPLLRRFVENQRVLNQVHLRLVALGDRRSLPGIDAEWLVDNFHIIADSLREVRHDLPPGYDELLPNFRPPLTGYPRVYALALALVAHCDSELDEARITRFVRAFQEAAPLTIGELWALPTMLRLVLLENLRRLAERMVWGWEERRRAERWANARSLGEMSARGHVPDPLRHRCFAAAAPIWGARPAQLRRPERPVRGPADAAPARPGRRDAQRSSTSRPSWPRRAPIPTRSSAASTTARPPTRSRSATACSASACSRRSTGMPSSSRAAMSRRSSAQDPAGIYPHQDFATSDRYRRMVETIARGSGADEIAVARRAIELARRRSGRGLDVDAADRAATSASTWSTGARPT